MNITKLSETEQREALSQAKKVRAKQLRDWSELSLKSDFSECDRSAWRELASDAGFRLPVSIEPCSVPRMRTYLRKMGVSHERYKSEAGHRLEDFVVLNPFWPLYAWVGTTLEIVG